MSIFLLLNNKQMPEIIRNNGTILLLKDQYTFWKLTPNMDIKTLLGKAFIKPINPKTKNTIPKSFLFLKSDS